MLPFNGSISTRNDGNNKLITPLQNAPSPHQAHVEAAPDTEGPGLQSSQCSPRTPSLQHPLMCQPWGTHMRLPIQNTPIRTLFCRK